MEKENRPAGEWLMKEGEPGDAMYVIQTGKLEVYVGGTLTRHVGRGGAVGELALLYHTPRSASVKVTDDHDHGGDGDDDHLVMMMVAMRIVIASSVLFT